MNDFLRTIFHLEKQGAVPFRQDVFEMLKLTLFLGLTLPNFDTMCCVIFFIKKKNNASEHYVIFILSILLCINGEIFLCLEYPNKYCKVHQGLDYIVYSLYWFGLY